MNLNLPRNSTNYVITGTETFRLSSRKILDFWGSNLQNVEKGMRKIYCADDGYELVQVDQAGAEALIVAYLCKKGNYRSLFENKVKPHTFVALHVFADEFRKRFAFPDTVDFARLSKIEGLKNIPHWSELDKLIRESDNWPSNERYYFIGKKICHASNYGMEGQRFALAVLKESGGKIALTKKQADSYLSTYHRLFPEIHHWHFEIQARVKKERMQRNLFGFPRFYRGYVGDSMFKNCYAWVPQSTVGTITNIAYTQLQNYIEDNGKDWHLLANTHDSYLCECPTGEVKECASKMQEFIQMTFKSPVDGATFTMKSEAQSGKNWAPYKEEENPEGLREICQI